MTDRFERRNQLLRRALEAGMSEIELLRAEAVRCRQLACLVIDRRVERTLLQMASECEYRADQIISENVKRADRIRTLMAEPEV